MLPLIGIPVPTSRDLEYNRRSWPQYARAVQLSGGDAVRIELRSRAEMQQAAASCDGFVLPGSPADVQPGRYGQEVDALCAPADLVREECDDLLLEAAERQNLPVLGICFGLQSMNVWRGGSLIQHLTPMPTNHGAGPEVAIAHSVLVPVKSCLASLLDEEEASAEGEFLRLPINTSHHQAVAAPGSGLRIVGRSPEDGVIEALEGEACGEMGAPFLLGVQWHPERSFDLSATSRALFAQLVVTAAARIAERNSVLTR